MLHSASIEPLRTFGGCVSRCPVPDRRRADDLFCSCFSTRRSA